MVKIIRYKNSVLFFILLVILSTLYFGCSNKSQTQNEVGFVDKNNISSFKIHNIRAEEKEIKDKADMNKIIDLINSVKITKTGLEERDGDGFGVNITYTNDKKFYTSFFSDTMVYSTDGSKSTWCEIDKNIVDDLRNYYDNN